jgi:hypothetical protein
MPGGFVQSVRLNQTSNDQSEPMYFLVIFALLCHEILSGPVVFEWQGQNCASRWHDHFCYISTESKLGSKWFVSQGPHMIYNTQKYFQNYMDLIG